MWNVSVFIWNVVDVITSNQIRDAKCTRKRENRNRFGIGQGNRFFVPFVVKLVKFFCAERSGSVRNSTTRDVIYAFSFKRIYIYVERIFRGGI